MNMIRRQVRHAQRYSDRERRAHARLALYLDGATMQMHQFLHQRQANAGPLISTRARSLHTMKPLEETGQFIRRNAGASVTHLQLRLPPVLVERDADLAAKGEL